MLIYSCGWVGFHRSKKCLAFSIAKNFCRINLFVLKDYKQQINRRKKIKNHLLKEQSPVSQWQRPVKTPYTRCFYFCGHRHKSLQNWAFCREASEHTHLWARNKSHRAASQQIAYFNFKPFYWTLLLIKVLLLINYKKSMRTYLWFGDRCAPSAFGTQCCYLGARMGQHLYWCKLHHWCRRLHAVRGSS